MRLTIEIDFGAQPIAGWLEPEGESRREFVGMLELSSLLERLREHAVRSPSEAQVQDAR